MDAVESPIELISLISGLGDLDPAAVIYAAKPWTAASVAVVLNNDEPPERLPYLLEVELAQDAVEVWSEWRGGRTPTPIEKLQAIVHYAEFDAYIPADAPAEDPSETRLEVQAFIAEGPLSGCDSSAEEIDRRGEQLRSIQPPVTSAEAKLLADCFGPDDCYGVAWTLLHLIETGPNPVLTNEPGLDANEWQHRLWQRAVNGGLVPGL